MQIICFKKNDIHLQSFIIITFAMSPGVVEYIDCTSAEGLDPSTPTNVLCMTLNWI